jgi:adenylate kinase
MKNLIFFGIQGSGKGTQAKLLAQNFGYTIFETGSELRNIAKEDSDLGCKVKETIESGHLVSTELVIEILKDFIHKHKNVPVIFDGIPRSDDQNKLFRELLTVENVDYLAVHFKLDKEEAFKRLLKRAEIENRADDNEESINRRIDIFFNSTVPVIETFSAENKLIEIDAKPSIEEIYQTLSTSIQ